MILLSTGVSAQEGFQFGARVIPTWSWFMNEDDEGQATSGTCYGVGANYHWADGIGAGVDLLWGTETQVFDPGGTGDEWTLERSVFKLPVLLHFNSQAEDVVPFLGYVGLERVVVREVSVRGPGGIDPEGIDLLDDNGTLVPFRSEELYRSSDLGAVLGFGPGWNINEKMQFTAIVRAEYLFNDPEDKDSATGALIWGDRPRTTLVTLGIDLGLKVIFGD